MTARTSPPFPTSAPAERCAAFERPASPSSSRGYTVIELLMSLAVLAAGLTGVIAMQKVTVVSNSHAKNLALATHIAQSWLGMLSTESALWNEDGLLTRAPFLAEAAASPGEWIRPTYQDGAQFGAGFDALGNPLPDTSVTESRFCADVRLTPLQDATGGAGLSRVEVRVIWPREGRVSTGVSAPGYACEFAVDTADDDEHGPHLHSLFLAGAVRQVVRGGGN